jgi:2,4-dienoyl-CoA reductase-like NADH-dependent reductase (Old Yellow Enzyme family)
VKSVSEGRSFFYRHADEIRRDAESRNLYLPWSEDLSFLRGPVRVGTKIAPSRFAALPVEGRDADTGGAPTEMTFRRYRRCAAGGSGIIHFEAVAFSPQGRASDHQMMLNGSTAPRLKKLLDETKAEAERTTGHTPLCYLQLQESGRYVHAAGMSPRLVVHCKEMDDLARVSGDAPLLTDDALARICDQFVEAAALAYELGFDGVDVKACHRYLTSELLAAHARSGRYGGSYDNRVRMVLDMIDGVRQRVPDENYQIVSRLNLYDAIEWPYGWGVKRDSSPPEPDLEEPLKLLRRMREKGVVYVSATCGTPYGRAWVNRPFERAIPGASPPPEHPLEGVCRGIALTAEAQKAVPEMPMSGFAYSWLREFIPNVAAGVIAEGGAAFVGLGRELLAYPDMPRDILEKGFVDRSKVCVTCSYCSEVMARGGVVGCFVRDREGYGEIFGAYKKGEIIGR